MKTFLASLVAVLSLLMQASPVQAEESPRNLLIKALIEKLAISQLPAEDFLQERKKETPRPEPSPEEEEEMKTRAQEASAAADDLGKLGREAWPQLFKHLADKRQSIAVKRISRHPVGVVCYSILENQIIELGPDYRAAFPYQRKGPDGEYHVRPYYQNAPLYNMGSIEAWLKEREVKSLPEIQLEILDWYLARERKIGFASKDEETEIAGALTRQRWILIEKIKGKDAAKEEAKKGAAPAR
jgi:hypothetical protein